MTVPPIHTRWPWALALLTALAGLIISIALWRQISLQEQRALEDTFRIEADALYDATVRELRLFWDVLDSIRLLHSISEQVRPTDFEEFVEKGMLYQQRVLDGFGFVQRIPSPTRRLIEEAYAEDPSSGFSVVERAADGTMIAAAERAQYFVLTWQYPTNALGYPLGYDFAGEPVSRQAIDHLARTGNAAIGESLSSSGACLAFAPITVEIPEIAGGYLVGFVVARLDPAAILQRARAAGASRGLQVTLEPTRAVARAPGELIGIRDIPVANQHWIWTCTAGPAYAPELLRRPSGWLLLAGLLLTALVTSQMLWLAGRSRRVEQLVAQRTEELSEANRQLEGEMQERLRLEAALQDVGARERRRLGHDLHDSLGQKLTGAVFLSRALLTRLKGADGKEEEHALKLNETLKEAVSEVRSMARGLAPVALVGEDLGEALVQMAAEMTDLYGVPCEAYVPALGGTYARRVKEQLYLIAREAAQNAARHAGATRVQVRLSEAESGGMLLVVEDNGKGVPPGAKDGEGMGLRIMKGRAQLIGGAFVIEAVPEGGTRIKVSL